MSAHYLVFYSHKRKFPETQTNTSLKYFSKEGITQAQTINSKQSTVINSITFSIKMTILFMGLIL